MKVSENKRNVMDNSTGEWIVNLVAALGGWKIIEWIVSWREKKRKSIADVVAAETDPLIRRYTTMESEMEKLKAKVDELYKMVHKLEKEKIELLKRNMELEIALKESRYNECRRPDDDCIRRLPQREICLAKKLIGGLYDKNDGIPEESDKG